MVKHLGRIVSIRSTGDHEATSDPLATAGRVILTAAGEVDVVMHQRACHGNSETFHSSVQVKLNKNEAYDISINVDGGQNMITLGRHGFPTPMRSASPCISWE